MEEKPKSDKTAISIKLDTADRMKAYMKYGDTFNGMITMLLDFYEKYKDIVSNGDKNGSS
jgi:hypothetical protein